MKTRHRRRNVRTTSMIWKPSWTTWRLATQMRMKKKRAKMRHKATTRRSPWPTCNPHIVETVT